MVVFTVLLPVAEPTWHLSRRTWLLEGRQESGGKWIAWEKNTFKIKAFSFVVNRAAGLTHRLFFVLFFSWVFGAGMTMRLNDSSDAHSLRSGATMVVQLRCPDALKALPCLTGHENVPSAHFGHRALRTFNWTITHEEKKTNHIIELLSASAGATKSRVVSAVFAPAVPEVCLHGESRWPWLQSRCAADGLYLWATHSG